jgi:predicted ATPase
MQNEDHDPHNAWMFARHLQAAVETALSDYPAVALLGARQVGKTTLARQIEQLEFLRPAVYWTLSAPATDESSPMPRLICRCTASSW